MKTFCGKNSSITGYLAGLLLAVVLLVRVIGGWACDKFTGCKLGESYYATWEGKCTSCSMHLPEPCNWNCHKAVSHAHGGIHPDFPRAIPVSKLGLKENEKYEDQSQFFNEEGDEFKDLTECDILLFGDLGVDEEKDGLIVSCSHSAVATGEVPSGSGTIWKCELWQAGGNSDICEEGCYRCLNRIDGNTLLTKYGNKCTVFPADKIGE